MREDNGGCMPMMGALSIYCPHCHKHTSLEVAPVVFLEGHREQQVGAVWHPSGDIRWWIGVCNACNRPVLVLNKGATIYPSPLPEPTDVRIPEPMRGDLTEAKQCLAVSAWRATAVMARRAMQSAAIEREAKKDKLKDQIEELEKAGKITTDLKEWADAVRWVGNDAAHPGGDPVDQDDAKEVLALAEQFLHVLYVTPARAKELRKKKGR
jgi:hypothetical protein